MNSYNKLFMIIRKTDLLNYDERTELKLYLMNLQEQVKKQKEVIDKAIDQINYYKINCGYDGRTIVHDKQLDELLDILKEVSE